MYLLQVVGYSNRLVWSDVSFKYVSVAASLLHFFIIKIFFYNKTISYHMMMSTIVTTTRGTTRVFSPLVLLGGRHGKCQFGTNRTRLSIRASDDEDMVPILSGRKKKGFTKKEYEQLKHPKLLGGKTIGEELSMLRREYLSAEERARDQSHHEFTSDNWQGDVYVGSRWNTLSVLYGIMMLSILGGLVGAYATYGHLWGVTPGLY